MSDTMVVTRFAPSPTGFMHVGNLRTALYSYLIAKHSGGKFILRIEDTDQERFVEGATEVILNTLRMTGLKYDEGPDVGGPNGPYIQSQRKEIYQKYAKWLVDHDYAYYCFCSEERLRSLHDENGIGGYDRHCRNLPKEEIEAHLKNGDPYVIRQKMPLTGTTTYFDEVYGEQSVENKELQDQILMKADGYPTYNFAHIVDDHLMGVNYVVRGNEYITSTPKYVLLYDAFGWERPHYVHLPLLCGKNPDGSVSKLSKRHGAVSFEELVKQGFLPDAIVNYLAFLGWAPKDTTQEIFSLEELVRIFTIDGIGKSNAVFDYEKLKWFNAEYLKKLNPDDFYDRIRPIWTAADMPAYVNQKKLAGLVQSRVSTLNESADIVDFVLSRLPYDEALYTNKKNKTTPELCLQILETVRPALEAAPAWENDALFELLQQTAADLGVKKNAVMWAVRIAIARKAVTPGGATELMEVFGREESLSRMDQAIRELGA